MFGDNLKKYRTEKGLSQSDLAEKLFVTRQCVSKWEKNITEPDLQTLSRISEVLGVPVEALLKDVGSSVKKQPDYNFGLFVTNILIAVFSVFAFLVLWRFLPKTIPTHFNIEGAIDRYGSRNEVFINLATMVVFIGVDVLVYFAVKRIKDLKTVVIGHVLIALVQVGYIVFIIVVYAKYLNAIPSFVTCIAAAIILCLSVGMHPKLIKQNYFLGVRTKATLSSTEVWNKTNALCSYMFLGLSAVIYTVNMCVMFDLSNLCLLAYIIPVIIAKVYSDVIYKRTEKE